MSYFAIKIVAILFMTIDHVGYLLLGNMRIFRLLGRISFPLFAFLLVNGYHHTKNKTKYLSRMLVMSLVSEVFYDLAFHRQILEFGGQNVFFTLTAGLLAFIVTDKCKDIITSKMRGNFANIAVITSQIGILGFFMLLNRFVRADYGWYGIVVIYFLFLTYGAKIHNKFMMLLAIVFANMLNIFMNNAVFQANSILAVIFIFLFKDKNVSVPKWLRTLCYIFYPAHLFVLYLINYFM